jgi:prephenate dehydrogenase
MDGDDFFSDVRIAILGLGLIGGSLALRLRGKCAALVGIDPDLHTLALAQRSGIVDQAAAHPGELVSHADLIILAAPVRAILSQLRELPGWHNGSPVVLDVGSTKAAICAGMAELPARFDPVGGHPMSGKEKTGLAHASADLFLNAPFALTALPRTSWRAREIAENLAHILGARPVWVDPETHDRWVAATSHVPYLAACALSLTTPPEAAALAGPGFRSTTRVAETNPLVMLDILITNQPELLSGLGRLRSSLEDLEADLRNENWDRLRQTLQQAVEQRRSILSEPVA